MHSVSLWLILNSIHEPARVEDVVRVEFLLDAFQQDDRFGAAAPDEVRREAFERAGDDDQAAAELHRGRPQLADEHVRQVGVTELGEAGDDDAAAGVGLDRAVRIERQ